MIRFCNLIVSGAVFFLLLFTPFAFGAVHPWAYIVMESAIFITVGAALVKVFHLRRCSNPLGRWLPRLAVPYGLFLGLVLMQLMPLPPSLLGLISPNSYALYQTSLPGWPDRTPYSELTQNSRRGEPQPRLLPTPEQVRQGAFVPLINSDAAKNLTAIDKQESKKKFGLAPRSWNGWRPLSIASALTVTDLLKFIAYGALFFLILLYPFGAVQSPTLLTQARPQRSAEATFIRCFFLLLLFSGFAVALIGIVHLFAGNDKILWFYIPYDWQSSTSGPFQRASGPFINPDHFANYLSLIFPFTLSFALWLPALPRPDLKRGLRLICAFASLILFSAILLSLSRVGWFSVLLSSALLVWARRLSGHTGPGALNLRRLSAVLRYGALIAILLLSASLWFIGPQGRLAVDQRLAETVNEDDLGLTGRWLIWQDGWKLIGDFPLLGTGLGTWSDSFRRYQSRTSVATFYREAHNDYLELLAETGIVGFALLALFFFQGARLVLRGLRGATNHTRALLVPCVTALAIMFFHELFDFSLQIPANAILFTVIFAVTVRLTAQALGHDRSEERPIRPWLPAGAIALAVLLAVVALNQELVPFPYNLSIPKSVAEAAERIHAHPAQAVGHIMMARLAAERSSLAEQSREYGIAVWLQPADVNLRDLYASALLREGRREQALKEIRESVRLFPSLASHFYLHNGVIPWLAPEEKLAIVDGFESAADPAALENLATFFERTGDFNDQAKTLERASLQAKDVNTKIENALKAGHAYIKTKDSAKAQELFQNVIALRPADARAYQALAVFIHAPAGDRDQIAKTIDEGIRQQGDPLSLYLSLAQAMQLTGAKMEAQAALRQANAAIASAEKRGENPLPLFLALAETAAKIGQHDAERDALEKAVERRPSSTDTLNRLAGVYLRLRQYDRAARMLQRVTQLRPDSADAFFQLARAEEIRYGYAAADAAYAHAAELAPGNQEIVSRRAELKQKIAANLKTEPEKLTRPRRGRGIDPP